ncbi:hypothetical protein QBE53_06320 [Vallitaleaceae bacterium 9-2]
MDKLLIAVICLALLTGCSNNKAIIKEYEDKITNLEDELEISNNMYLDERVINDSLQLSFEQLSEENIKLSSLIDERVDTNVQSDEEAKEIASVVSDLNYDTNRFSNSGYLYDYEKFAQYKITNFDDVDLYEMASLLQPKGLQLLTVEMNESNLKITYELDLRYENQRYYFYYNREIQDSIIILAIFDEIKSVEFDYVIPDKYSVSALPYTRNIINAETSIDLQSYDVTEEFISNELPNILNGFYYNPEIMRFATYEHAMGLD